MYRDILKIPKTLKQVTMWVHPEGQVVGSVFVRTQSTVMAREEEPAEVLNQADPFLILQLGKSEHQEVVRFYNKASIVRLEYRDEKRTEPAEMASLRCTLWLMDGSTVAGEIRKPLPPDRARLFDYLNLTEERFVKMELGDSNVCLVNKSYIVSVTP
jgi:hypothetical protein